MPQPRQKETPMYTKNAVQLGTLTPCTMLMCDPYLPAYLLPSLLSNHTIPPCLFGLVEPSANFASLIFTLTYSKMSI